MQHQKRLEAEKLLAMDEEVLKKQMNAKRAREEAEKIHKARTSPLITEKCYLFIYCVYGKILNLYRSIITAIIVFNHDFFCQYIYNKIYLLYLWDVYIHIRVCGLGYRYF